MSYTYDPPECPYQWYKPWIVCRLQAEISGPWFEPRPVVWTGKEDYPWMSVGGMVFHAAEPVEAWEPKPDEWVIARFGTSAIVLLQYKHAGTKDPIARYEQADGTLTDLRGGWDAVKDRTEVLNGQ